MSDEPLSSAAAAAAAAAAATSTSATTPYDENERTDAAPAPESLAERRKKNRILFNSKRGELLDDLLRSLDILIYAELSAIYYMDCYFFRFCMRAFVQFLFLTPKPAFFPDTPPNRPYIGAIFGSNILCLILHLAFSAPSASDATRGYLHGGLAMDFIGQKGPSSKTHLAALDVLVLALQLTHLAGHLARQRLKDAATKALFGPAPENNSSSDIPAASQGQSIDDEERGVRRSVEEQQRQHQDGIELQTLDFAGAAAAGGEQPDGVAAAEAGLEEPESSELSSSSSDRAAALLASTALPRSDAHIFDAFNSGQIVLADLNLPRTVVEQFWAYQKISWETTQTDPARFLRQRLVRGGLRWRFDTPGL